MVSGEYRTNYLNSYAVWEKSRVRYQGGIPEGWLITVCDPFRVEMHNAPFNALRANICDPFGV